MLIKTKGIVLHSRKYSETSLIVDIFTEAKGLRSYIISGVRTKKAKVSASLLQAMSLVEMVVYHREDKNLTRTKEIKPALVFHSIPFDVQKGAVGLFMVEIAKKTLRESEENPRLFEFLFSTFKYLDQTAHPISNLHLHFLLKLSGFLGFLPESGRKQTRSFFDLQEGIFVNNPPTHPHYLNKELSLLLDQLLRLSKEQSHALKMTRAQRKTLLEQLLVFYKLHLENFPAIYSHLILEEVLK